MFSGIIREIGKVSSLKIDGESAVLGIEAPMFRESESFQLGDSVAISGVCLTVIRREAGVGYFDLASETRRRTTLGGLNFGSKVNLERSLRFGERLDGHMVQGHVEAVATVISVQQEGNTYRFVFSLPGEVKPYVANKGSISVDGVSLTVCEVTEDTFSVYIIPHTLAATTFHEYCAGTAVNLESDCIARYLKALAEPYLVATNR